MSPEYAKRFLRGGGSVSLSEWDGLTEEGREALYLAGEEIRRDMLMALARALIGPDDASTVYNAMRGRKPLVLDALIEAARMASTGDHHG